MDKLLKYRLQSRMLEVKKALPESALGTFFDKFPEHKHDKAYIYSIYNLRFVDELIIEKFESLVTK